MVRDLILLLMIFLYRGKNRILIFASQRSEVLFSFLLIVLVGGSATLFLPTLLNIQADFNIKSDRFDVGAVASIVKFEAKTEFMLAGLTVEIGGGFSEALGVHLKFTPTCGRAFCRGRTIWRGSIFAS